jgi:hypothetical protein
MATISTLAFTASISIMATFLSTNRAQSSGSSRPDKNSMKHPLSYPGVLKRGLRTQRHAIAEESRVARVEG